MLLIRPPLAALRPFVRQLWMSEPEPGDLPPVREHVLPTGLMHLAVRLSGPPLRVYGDGVAAIDIGHAVVGGARTCYYAREGRAAAGTVGAMLEPGGAQALFRIPAGELAHRHTVLVDLPGFRDGELFDRLAEAPAACRLAVLESLLLRRLAGAPAPPPAVVLALRGIDQGHSVKEIVRACGYSHRHLLTLFRDATGLAPKEYARMRRMQRMLADVRGRARDWADAAAAAGFSDQAHFAREFREFAGMTPRQWLRAAPEHVNHVATSTFDKTPGTGARTLGS